MKILHLGDLHLGKRLNDILLTENQEFVLNQAIETIKEENIKAVLISGDVFDKQIPSIEAINLFNNFLEKLNDLNLKVFIISGNHDNIERLSYLSSFLEKSNIYFSKNFDGKLQKYDIEENISIYLMPYLYPAVIRKFYPDDDFKNYNDAIKKVIEQTETDKNKTNILLAHQFVSGADMPVLSESEQKSVGLVDMISYKIFDKFDYTALGHLHCPQKAGRDTVRYSGSILKYSLSEINQKKVFTIINAENKKIEFKLKEIKFLQDIKQYKGKFKDFCSEEFYLKINTKDFIHFILQDEIITDAKKELSRIYPNIILLEFDNDLTKKIYTSSRKINCSKTPEEHFCDFYEYQTGQKLDDFNKKLLEKLILKEDKCAL